MDQIAKVDPNLGMGASAALEPWAVATLEALRAEAERLATEFAARTLRERTARPRYLAKGRGDRYPCAAFRDAQSWELAVVEAFEPRLARTRPIARSVAALRWAAAHHDKRVRQLAEGGSGAEETDAEAAS